jgi:hypothetical protein
MEREGTLRRRIKALTWVFIVGLVVSGATAIPLLSELDWLSEWFSAERPSAVAAWIFRVRDGLRASDAGFPFLAYGTDWLAFGHFVIAIAFVGPLKDPVRNRWIYTFGMIACALVPPYALVFGAVRGIPLYWRGIDSCFGAFGILPLYRCWLDVRELEDLIGRKT